MTTNQSSALKLGAVIAILALVLALASIHQVTSVTLLGYSFTLFDKDPYAFCVRAMAASLADDELDYLGSVVEAEINGEDWSGDVVLAKDSTADGYRLVFFGEDNRPIVARGDSGFSFQFDESKASAYKTSKDSYWQLAESDFECKEILLSTFDAYGEGGELIKAKMEFGPWQTYYLVVREASQIIVYRMFRGLLPNKSWMRLNSWMVSVTVASGLGFLLFFILQGLMRSPSFPRFKNRCSTVFAFSAASGASLHLYGHLPALYHYNLFGRFSVLPLTGLLSLAGTALFLLLSAFTDKPIKSLGIAAFAILAGYIAGFASVLLLIPLLLGGLAFSAVFVFMLFKKDEPESLAQASSSNSSDTVAP
jgi:hypothetical protein